MSSEMILDTVRNTDAYVFCVKPSAIHFILQESFIDYYSFIVFIIISTR